MTSEAKPPAPERQDKASDYDYELPPELIATHPAAERDASRLLAVPPDPSKPVEHRAFRDLGRYLRAGDVLVLNDSKVIPARLLGRRMPGGGACEILLLRPLVPSGDGHARWTCLARPGKKLKPGTVVEFADDFSAEIEADTGEGEKIVRLLCGGDVRDALRTHGNMPLPPYILAKRGTKRTTEEDRTRYQTVYADPEGSAAAPTAGLHMTEELLEELREAGVEIHKVTLHVGTGTFQPIATEYLDEHRMHTEEYFVPESTADAVNRAKAEGRRVVALGTTSVRTLESAADEAGTLRAGRGESRLMIRPGYRWRIVDGTITNFHLPRSTLLCLVSALVGRERLLAIYAEAVAAKYRFYSYGDAMLLWRSANERETPG